ncbi:MAG: hypothetical protein K2K08_08420 [Paramuribaculum sp.]|nr:hypothetical protein [Paramuribaculum sp.]
MGFWNFIGEIALFRWLFGEEDKKRNDNKYRNQYHSSSSRYYEERDYSGWSNQSFDDFHEEQDDYDMMDDF